MAGSAVAAGCARTVGRGRRAPAHRPDGTLTTPFVIRAISKGTKDTRVRSVYELIERLLSKKWLNVVCAISECATPINGEINRFLLLRLFAANANQLIRINRVSTSISFARYVHNTCDAEANLATYHSKKESNPDYEYSCPPCKQQVQNGRMVALRRNNSIEDDSLSASQDSLGMDDISMDGSTTSTGKGKHAAVASTGKLSCD